MLFKTQMIFCALLFIGIVILVTYMFWSIFIQAINTVKCLHINTIKIIQNKYFLFNTGENGVLRSMVELKYEENNYDKIKDSLLRDILIQLFLLCPFICGSE